MRIQSRALVSGALVGAVLAACSAPVPLSRQFQKEDLDPAASPPLAAPPSHDELAHGDAPSDVAIPDMYKSDDPSSAEKGMGFAATGGLPVTVFLNRAGGTYTAGADDSSRHVSSVLSYYGRPSVTLPATGYSGAAWQELVDCVAAQYKGLNVAITDVKPTGGAYTELVVSNTWAGTALGITNGIGGIAPLGACRVVPQAVGFVFEAIYDTPGYGGVRGTCEAVSHEIGHTLSLSHERLSTDLMSYAPANPAKRFQDSPSACGVSAQAPESCSCGGATQSSRQQLLSMVGPGTGTGGGGGNTSGDTTAPTVSIVSPASGTTAAGNANVTIVVDANDDQGAAEVKLVWQYTGAVLSCDAAYAGVTCRQQGTRYTWTILVGSGTRSFYAYARDAAGNGSATTVISIEAAPATAPPVEDPPTVAVQLPADNQTIAKGSDLIFQAEVRGSRAISDVRAVWTYPGGSLEYPMALTTTPGVYQARTTVTTTAQPGWRGVEIQAADDKGRRTIAARRYVYVAGP